LQTAQRDHSPRSRRELNAKVDALQADLATVEGMDRFCSVVGGRPVDALNVEILVEKSLAETSSGRLIAKLIEEGKIDPSFVVTDRASLGEGPELYKKGGCIKVIMKP
jgi:threonine dehydrogenase-like Zn-dependent dehydrogenase